MYVYTLNHILILTSTFMHQGDMQFFIFISSEKIHTMYIAILFIIVNTKK